jgi:hypothetical protein
MIFASNANVIRNTRIRIFLHIENATHLTRKNTNRTAPNISLLGVVSGFVYCFLFSLERFFENSPFTHWLVNALTLLSAPFRKHVPKCSVHTYAAECVYVYKCNTRLLGHYWFLFALAEFLSGQNMYQLVRKDMDVKLHEELANITLK